MASEQGKLAMETKGPEFARWKDKLGAQVSKWRVQGMDEKYVQLQGPEG